MGKKSFEEIMRKIEQLGSKEQIPEIEENGIQEIEATDTKDISNDGQNSTSEASELANLRAIRDSLAVEVEKLRQQTKSAEQLLASYDALLKGTTQDNSQNTEAKGE